MSSSAHSNAEFALVTDKVCRLMTRSNKLKVGDPAAKTLAHEIAMALTTAFAQHGNAATSFSPLLLSCAAELRDKMGANGRLAALPNWNTISDCDPQIKSHPLFPKTVGYAQPNSAMPPPAVPRPMTPTPATPAPAPPTPTPAPAPALPTPAPAVTWVPGKLFVRGNAKRSAPMPDNDNDIVEVEEPAPKQQRTRSSRATSRACPKRAKLAAIVIDDVEDPPADQVVFVKNKTNAGPREKPPAPEVVNDDAPEVVNDDAPEVSSTAVGDDSEGTVRLFGIQCERCIRDDIPCAVILGKKLGEVRKCCRNCDEKKTKCVRPTPEQAEVLRAAAALKKSKAANRKTQVVKRTRSRARSTRARPPSPALSDQDAEGEDDAGEEQLPIAPAAQQVVDVDVPEIVPASSDHVDNDIDIDIVDEAPLPTSPAHTLRDDITADLPVPVSPAHALREVTPAPPAPQPSNLDILQTINTMRQEFSGMWQASSDHAEVIRREVNSHVDEVEDHLTARIAAMEKKMRMVDLDTAQNAVQIGHMANALRIITQPAGISAIGPVAGPSTQGHLFGDIPTSWLGRPATVEGDLHLPDGTLSHVGKQYTTAWDLSRGPAASGVGERIDAAVETVSQAFHQVMDLPVNRVEYNRIFSSLFTM
ncbi:hypothetical protein P692DRAFT_20874383 [Suillus brevipes Sb2]|nr:hypothetical protein P692DRAFT_20874383 [Suillus brevipes Sb2]